jgi:hypothetical protein
MEIHFVSEQDGVAERAFKSSIVNILVQVPELSSAYLVRARFGGDVLESIVLAFRTKTSLSHSFLVEKTGVEFGKMFREEQHLDVLFLDADQERSLREICRPFFGVGARPLV